MIVGVEFEKLTHWDRYLINQNLVKMERELFPDNDSVENQGEDEELWRGERRNFHRLSIRKLGIKVLIDLSTTRGGIYDDVLLLNLSPAGCCIQISSDSLLQPGSRIPRLSIPLYEERITLRGRVVHVAGHNSDKESDCLFSS